MFVNVLILQWICWLWPKYSNVHTHIVNVFLKPVSWLLLIIIILHIGWSCSMAMFFNTGKFFFIWRRNVPSTEFCQVTQQNQSCYSTTVASPSWVGSRTHKRGRCLIKTKSCSVIWWRWAQTCVLCVFLTKR